MLSHNELTKAELTALYNIVADDVWAPENVGISVSNTEHGRVFTSVQAEEEMDLSFGQAAKIVEKGFGSDDIW
jgi:hypothetical protein